MSNLREAKHQRSLLLQQLARLRIEIKDEAEIDLVEKWELLQSLPPQHIKIAGLGRGFDYSILTSHEQDVYLYYKENCLKFEKLIREFKAYYQTEDHKNIVQKIIKQINDNNTRFSSGFMKKKLISNLTDGTKRRYL